MSRKVPLSSFMKGVAVFLTQHTFQRSYYWQSHNHQITQILWKSVQNLEIFFIEFINVLEFVHIHENVFIILQNRLSYRKVLFHFCWIFFSEMIYQKISYIEIKRKIFNDSIIGHITPNYWNYYDLSNYFRTSEKKTFIKEIQTATNL